jgi:hypothetical protein
VGSCEHENGASVSVMSGEILAQLSHCWLYKDFISMELVIV